jgi:hypothetical protein
MTPRLALPRRHGDFQKTLSPRQARPRKLPEIRNLRRRFLTLYDQIK